MTSFSDIILCHPVSRRSITRLRGSLRETLAQMLRGYLALIRPDALQRSMFQEAVQAPLLAVPRRWAEQLSLTVIRSI